MKDIKLHDQVIYWYNGIMERGRVLDVKLEEDGMKLFIENLRTHETIILDTETVYREENCK